MKDLKQEEVKTLQQCKDEVGRKYLYKNWDDCISGFDSKEGIAIVGKRYDEASEMYADQFKVPKVITDEGLFDISLNAYCKHSEAEGFIFTTLQGRKSQDESNGYCIGYQNGHSDGIKYYRDQLIKKP